MLGRQKLHRAKKIRATRFDNPALELIAPAGSSEQSSPGGQPQQHLYPIPCLKQYPGVSISTLTGRGGNNAATSATSRKGPLRRTFLGRESRCGNTLAIFMQKKRASVCK